MHRIPNGPINPVTADDPYTRITITEYAHMKSVILFLRLKNQKAREYLEKGLVKETLALLREDKDDC